MPKSRGNKRSKLSKKSGSFGGSEAVELPDRRAIEGSMAAFLGLRGQRSGKPARDTAQQMMYQAFEASGRRRPELALRALEIDPDCADAYVLLAEETSESLEEARDFYARGLVAGERSLGKRTFERDSGHFWGILETRPYMRARAGLARCLLALGEREAAVEHYREMLSLNPNDNQGIRDVLLSCLLELPRDDEAWLLLDAYAEDASAMWAYSRALAAFRREGDSAKARKSLRAAIECNRHVPAFLLGRRRLPRRVPDLVGFGDESEAVAYAANNVSVWQQSSGALAWLESGSTDSR